MQFRKDRGQDDKDMAFETLGLKLRIFSLEREAFAFSRNDNFFFNATTRPVWRWKALD